MNDRNEQAGQGDLRFALFPLSESQIGGHVFDLEDLDRRFVVELLLDGFPCALQRADIYDPDLAHEGHGDGCYGFVFSIDEAALLDARLAEVRLANSDEILGAPLPLPAVKPPGRETWRIGGVTWQGGLRFDGWLAGDPNGARRVRALIDGQVVAEAQATQWTHIGEGRGAKAVRGFDLHLPIEFADGCAHHAQIFDDSGRELPGSPCAFAAFPDGLARYIEGRAEIESEKLRGELFDRLIPQALPFSMFAQWRERFFPPEAAGGRTKIAVALIGGPGAEASAVSLEAQIDCEWLAAVFEDGSSETAFDTANLREFLDGDAKDCALVVFAPAGTIFQPSALAALASALDAFPAAQAAYGDFTLPAEDDGEWPVALSAFDYERMLEQGAGALFFALRADFARQAVAVGANNLFRLFNFCQDGRRARGPRQSDSSAAAAPVHAPGFLARLPRLDPAAAARVLAEANAAHFSARGVAADIEPGGGALFPAVRIGRALSRAKASILIPTRDRVDLLKPCIDSVARTCDLARHEIVVLDNDSADPATFAYFEQLTDMGVRVARIGGPFNFARLVNEGAALAHGDHLLLMNNDIEARESGWLEEMLGRMAEPDVGAVGAALLWPSGVVQHGGVVLGSEFVANHAFNDRMDGDPGYADLLRAAHECSAVTAACLLTERRLFLDTGGFDAQNFPVNFNDVDYCLKLRARGLRIVMTPHAKLLHRESASRGRDLRPDQSGRFKREVRNLRAIWGDVLLADPYYNPLLSLDGNPFSALAWPPRPARPRQNFSAPPRPAPPGF